MNKMISVKKLTSILALVILISGSAFAQSKKSNKQEKETVTFAVSMTCENCKKRIEKKIAYEKGVTDMYVDLGNKTVKVEYKKDKTSPEKLQTAIEELGYDVSIYENKNQEENKSK